MASLLGSTVFAVLVFLPAVLYSVGLMPYDDLAAFGLFGAGVAGSLLVLALLGRGMRQAATFCLSGCAVALAFALALFYRPPFELDLTNSPWGLYLPALALLLALHVLGSLTALSPLHQALEAARPEDLSGIDSKVKLEDSGPSASNQWSEAVVAQWPQATQAKKVELLQAIADRLETSGPRKMVTQLMYIYNVDPGVGLELMEEIESRPYLASMWGPIRHEVYALSCPEGDMEATVGSKVEPYAQSANLYARGLKRMLDPAVAMLMLIAFLPLMAIGCLVIWFTLPRGQSLLITTKCIGAAGRTFELMRFRCHYWTETGHLVVGRVSRFLLWTGLHRLPTLFNVGMGEMALVGLRPLPLPHAFMKLHELELDQFISPAAKEERVQDLRIRVSLQPGLFVPSQVWQHSNREDLSWCSPRSRAVDHGYAAKPSFGLDTGVLLSGILTYFLYLLPNAVRHLRNASNLREVPVPGLGDLTYASNIWAELAMRIVKWSFWVRLADAEMYADG